MAGRRTSFVAVLGVLVLGAAPFLGAATAGAGEVGEPPPPGSTYQGTAPNVRVDLTALAPDSEGGVQLRGLVALACGTKRLSAALDDQVTGRVAPDGTVDIRARVAGPAEGIQTFGNVRLRGTFTDTGLDATVRYSLVETDDTDEVIDECEVGPVSLDTVSGPVDPGVERLQATIPVVKPANPHYQATTAASATDVFVAVRKSEFTLEDLTTLLLRIDPETNEVVRRRTVDADLWGLVTVGDHLFGIDVTGGNVVPIDPVTLTVEDPIEVARGTDGGQLDRDTSALWPRAAAVDGSLWVSAPRDGEIVRIDPESGEILGRVSLERHPTDLAAGPAGLYAATEGEVVDLRGDGVAVRIDPATMTVAASSASSANLGTVVADASQVVMSDDSPDGEAITRLDPVTLVPTLSRSDDHPDPLLAAPPGIWGFEYSANEIVALDPNLVEVARVVMLDVGDNDVQASSGFGSVWVYDEGLRLLYRIAS